MIFFWGRMEGGGEVFLLPGLFFLGAKYTGGKLTFGSPGFRGFFGVIFGLVWGAGGEKGQGFFYLLEGRSR